MARLFLERICKCVWRKVLYRQNDNGGAVRFSNNDRRELLVIIPRKITYIMGFVADVNQLYENGLLYIEIKNIHSYSDTRIMMRMDKMWSK